MKNRIEPNFDSLLIKLKKEKVNFPKLSKWARTNPETLKQQLISIANTWHEGDINSAALALESDKGH